MMILWTVIISGLAVSCMEIVYYYCNNKQTWMEFVYDYGESGDVNPEQYGPSVQTSMFIL